MRVVNHGAVAQTANTTGESQSNFTPKLSPKQRAVEAWNKAAKAEPAASSQVAETIETKPAVTAKEESFVESKSNVSDTIEGPSESIESAAPSAPSEPSSPTEKAEDPLSSQYAILARKEKALRARMAQEKAAIEAEKAKLEQERSAFQKPSFDESKYISKDDLLKNPLDLLAQLGVSYDTLVEQAINAPKDADIKLIRTMEGKFKDELEKINKSWEDKFNSLQKSQEENQQKAYNDAVKQISSKVNRLVDSNPEEFETIKATGSQADVVELIEKTFKEDGTILTEEEAAREVEKHLVEELSKYTKLNKLQKLLKSAESTSQQAVKRDESSKPAEPQLKTLTNAVTTTKKLSARDRAMRAFRGEKID